LLSKWNAKPSKKGTGFEQPPQSHQHWHIDVSYINIGGTFYYLCSVLDGYSRGMFNSGTRHRYAINVIQSMISRQTAAAYSRRAAVQSLAARQIHDETPLRIARAQGKRSILSRVIQIDGSCEKSLSTARFVRNSTISARETRGANCARKSRHEPTASAPCWPR